MDKKSSCDTMETTEYMGGSLRRGDQARFQSAVVVIVEVGRFHVDPGKGLPQGELSCMEGPEHGKMFLGIIQRRAATGPEGQNLPAEKTV